MKWFLVLCAVAGLAAAATDIDYSKVRPVYEFKEWQDAHPGLLRFFRMSGALEKMPKTRFGPNGRIVGGTEADRHQFPYQAGLFLHMHEGIGFCGGSLVSKNYVMTAAHCIDSLPSMTVVLGAHNVFESEATQQRIEVPAANFRIYPNWDAEIIRNDLAVARLPVEANYGQYISSVRLPNWNQVGMTFVGQEAFVSGWGRFEDRNNDLSTFLRAVRVPVITNLACRTRFPQLITDEHICTFGGLGGPCDGDNGGPLSVVENDGRTTQVGVISFGFTLSCELNWPSAYLRVTSFLGWIEENTDRTIAENWN